MAATLTATSAVAAPLSSPTSTTHSRRYQDTGFPEPLSEDRNTTLAHPEADHAPGEEISAAVIGATTADEVHRRRHGLGRVVGGHGHSHKKNSSGHITMTPSLVEEEQEDAVGDKVDISRTAADKQVNPNGDGGSQEEGAASGEQQREGGGNGNGERERKKGVLWKVRH
ncbi:MAG: hypothetical protein M1825_003875 [Sarcosagium campestre]|nr:MAG: hypothetical protein M1825_003875 [Sarcosagium campestre]